MQAPTLTGRVETPSGAVLPSQFTSATRGITRPDKALQIGIETDTGLLYYANGTNPGDWQLAESASTVIPDTVTSTQYRITITNGVIEFVEV